MAKIVYNGLYGDTWLEDAPEKKHKSTFLDLRDLQHSGRNIFENGEAPKKFIELLAMEV